MSQRTCPFASTIKLTQTSDLSYYFSRGIYGTIYNSSLLHIIRLMVMLKHEKTAVQPVVYI